MDEVTTAGDAADDGRLSADRQRLLERRLAARRSMSSPPAASVAPSSRSFPEGARPDGGSPSSGADAVDAPLSASQRQLWYLAQQGPDATEYNEIVTLTKSGPCDVDAARGAINDFVARHEAWRTTFHVVDGEPRQRVHRPALIDVPLLDLSELPPEQADSEAFARVADETRRPYDLRRGPLLRPRLVRFADCTRIYLAIHHLIFDGVTLSRVFFPEFVALYDARVKGVQPRLPQLSAAYTDYARWEVDWVDGPLASDRFRWWQRYLTGLPVTEVTPDRPRPRPRQHHGGVARLQISAATAARVSAIAAEVEATPFQVLFAAYAYWLARYSEQDEVAAATVGDLRRKTEFERLVGYALAPVVVRVDFRDQPTFLDLIRRIRDHLIDALDHAVPFEPLVRALRLPRDPETNPLFRSAFVLEPETPASADGWSLRQLEYDVTRQTASSKFDFTLTIDQAGDGGLEGRLLYDASLFGEAAAGQLADNYAAVLDALTSSPRARTNELDLLSAARPRPLEAWPGAVQMPAPEVNVPALVLAQAARTPTVPAVVAAGTELAYQELVERAARIAARLRAAGARPASVVAVLLDRSVDMVCGLLGVLMSGAAYLPLDASQPAARLRFLVEDAGADLVLSVAQLAEFAPPTTGGVIIVEDAVEQAAADVAPGPATGADLAYVIYTSGSTGRPKGVQIEHSAAAARMLTLFPTLGIGSNDRVATVASYTFDMSVGDLFGALAVGATLVVASSAQAADPRALAVLLDQSHATAMRATPTTWSALVRSGWAGRADFTAVSGGEPLPELLAAELRSRCGSLWNGYGPTEATVVTACGIVDDAPINVGRPLTGVRVYLLDRRGRPVLDGMPAEVVIGGAGIARGYLHRPTETQRAFAPDPTVPDARVYRSGDRGRVLADGRLQLLGRYDDQLKVRGYRIEPGEIEAALLGLPGVHAAAVMSRRGSDGVEELVAYLATGAADPSDLDIRRALRRQLPEYMVPSGIVRMPELPRTAGGKLDRSKLAAVAPPPRRDEVRAHRTATEARLAALWSQLLQEPVDDMHADFFNLGGYSLLAVSMLSRVESEFRTTVPLTDFLTAGTTVAGLAVLVDDGSPAATRRPRPTVAASRLTLIYPDPTNAMSARDLLEAESGRIRAAAPRQQDGRFDLNSSVEQLASELRAELVAEQPDGPYQLAGYSFGGLLAYEVARQLIQDGRHVDWVGIVDTSAPTLAAHAYRLHFSPWGRWLAVRRMPAAQRRARYAALARYMVRHPVAAMLRPITTSEEPFDFRGALLASREYSAGGHSVPVKLFLTRDSVTHMRDDTLGWRGYHAGPLVVHQLPGRHNDLFRPPQAVDVVSLLVDRMQAASTPRSA